MARITIHILLDTYHRFCGQFFSKNESLSEIGYISVLIYPIRLLAGKGVAADDNQPRFLEIKIIYVS